MGVKGVFRFPNGGGVLCCRLSIHQTGTPLLKATSRVLHHSKRTKRHRIRSKQVKNEFFFGVLWCFLGNFGDRKGRNLNIFLKCGCKVGAGCGSACLTFGVSTGVSVPDLSGIQDLPEVALVLWWCVPSLLSALLLCACRVACKCGSISRFKGVFRGFVGFVWVCVACVLCVACGAFVRVNS